MMADKKRTPQDGQVLECSKNCSNYDCKSTNKDLDSQRFSHSIEAALRRWAEKNGGAA